MYQIPFSIITPHVPRTIPGYVTVEFVGGLCKPGNQLKQQGFTSGFPGQEISSRQMLLANVFGVNCDVFMTSNSPAETRFVFLVSEDQKETELCTGGDGLYRRSYWERCC